MVSGEELTIALEEGLVPNVGAVKQQLTQRHGSPARFRQRLLLRGQCLEDTAAVHAGMDLEVVVSAFIPDRSPDEVQEFTVAAEAGDFDKVHAENETDIRTLHGDIVNRSCSAEGLIF